MTAFLIVLAVAAEAYLLGSVNGAIIVSRFLFHSDVRTMGSGNAGHRIGLGSVGGLYGFKRRLGTCLGIGYLCLACHYERR